MNKSKGNMYGFVTHTWNPITGKCIHDCSYCYMKRWKLNDIHLNEKVLNQNLGSNKFIFIGSGTDMFSDNVKGTDINRVLDCCRKYDNEYLFQSKNPHNILKYLTYMPLNTIICTTIESDKDYPQMNNSPTILQRYSAIKKIRQYGFQVMVTIEPIMDFDLIELQDLIKEINPIQVNIGADSGNNNLTEPNCVKTNMLISHLERFTKVHIKDNLHRIIKESK